VREYGPEIPEDVEFSMLDREVRARLRTLSKDNAWAVGRHLVMAGRLIDEDPELAYEHAQAAVRHGGRVDVVREAAGLAAYRTGRFAEALRELRTVPEDLVRDVVMCRLAMVGLSARDADKRPSDLSGGMVKRVALARALSLDPELLFLDEPTAGLDPLRSDEFVDLVRSLHRQLGFTVVMVTHDLDTLLALATRVAVLADKRVIVCDTVPEVLKVDHPFIHTFFLGERGLRALGDLAPKELHHGKP
jgi:phospholipid/cholesterol/gamma-HCH transport system ATP-binding protein